jgi:RiboL-PSP-HEPN
VRIPRIDRTLEICEAHLSAASAYGAAIESLLEIESLLTYSVLIVMCAEFEREVKAILGEKCASVPDVSIRDFLASSVDAVFRSLISSEIAGLLNRFGARHKERFNQKKGENPRYFTFYDNIVTNRHRVAHSEGSNATFQEVKKFYEEGHVVLDFFRDALLPTDADERGLG